MEKNPESGSGSPGAGNNCRQPAIAESQKQKEGGKIMGPRVHLRLWLDSDAETLYRWASDPEVGPRAGWPPHKSAKDSLGVIRSILRGNTSWAVALNGSGLPIGSIGYLPASSLGFPCREGEPTVGYWIAKPYWNQGYCTEALQLLIERIIRQAKIESLVGGHFVDNPASGRVMEKCGFLPTGGTCAASNLQTGDTRPIRLLRLELGPKE